MYCNKILTYFLYPNEQIWASAWGDVYAIEVSYPNRPIRVPVSAREIMEDLSETKSYDHCFWKSQLLCCCRYLADEEIKKIIESAKVQSKEIYDNLLEFDPHKQSARGELEKINHMFSMNIDFENEWLKFIGIPV